MTAVICFSLLGIGSLVSLIGAIMLLIAAFQAGVLWGLAVLFIPLANVVFAVAKWDQAKKAFLIQVAGFLVCCGGIVGVLTSGARAVLDAGQPGQTGEDPGMFDRMQSTFDSARTSFKENIALPSRARSAGPEGYVGRQLRELRTELGRPKGEMRFGRKTAWMYDEFTLMSEDGVTVQSVVLKKDSETIAAMGGPEPLANSPQTADAADRIKVISNGGAQVDLASILVPGKITIVDFYADWCGPCRVMAPDLESLVQQNPGVFLRKVDIVNWDTPVTAQYRISSVPNVRVFGSDGKMVGDPTHNIVEVRALVQQAR